MMAQRKLCEAEAEVEARNWEKRNSDFVFRRPIKNLNLSDFSDIKQINGQIKLRETKSACTENGNGEISSSKKIMQGFVKNLKN